jgi:hypothetical protein
VATTQKAGSIYEVGINGVGYMLADNAQRPVRRQTGVLNTQAPGSDDPLSERIGLYDFLGMSDWTGGEGQDMLDRPRSDVTRYFYSEYVDPFTVPGRLACQRVVTQVVSSSYDDAADSPAYLTNSGLVGSGGVFYLQTSATQLTDNEGTAFSTGLAGDMVGLAFDGRYWYASDQASVRRNNSSANPGSDWSTENVMEIAWCSDRLVGSTNSTLPSTLYEFSSTGTATAVTTAHPAANFSTLGLAGGDGYVWYGVNQSGTESGSSSIYFYQVDAEPAHAGIALQLPEGEVVHALFYYLGNLFVSAHVAGYQSGGAITYINSHVYRCVHQGNGTLIPQLIIETMYPIVARFAGSSKYVAIGWSVMTRNNDPGIAVIDLETGGVARWAASTAGSADACRGVVPFDNGFAFRVNVTGGGAGGGAYWSPMPNTTEATSVDFTTGVLETSTSDLGTPALKHLDEILVSSLPLPSGSSIAVQYSIDGGANYTTAATFTTASATQHSIKLATAVVAASFRLKVTLTPNVAGDAAPTVTALLAKTHATGIVDDIIELPINCEDHIADVNGSILAEDSGAGKGMARYRTLKALIGTKVEFQDVDWKVTGDAELWEVVGIEATAVQVFNPARQVNDVSNNVAIVTLRRPSSSD